MNTLRRHYPEYFMEAASLGIFMVSASVVTALLQHPASPLRQAISEPLLRRFLIGVAMGLTAIAIVYSPYPQNCCPGLHPQDAAQLANMTALTHEPTLAPLFKQD